MSFKNYIFLILVFVTFLQVSAQEKNKVTKYIDFDGNISDLSICLDCELKVIVTEIKKRIELYPFNKQTIYKKEKNDTLIEILEFNKNGQPNYSFFLNNLSKINYSQVDSNDFSLTIMDDFEMEKKTWFVSPKEIHLTEYDNSAMTYYLAQIFPTPNEKIEFEKKWDKNKLIYGKKKIFKKSDANWTLSQTEDIGWNDWPESTSEPINLDTISGLSELGKINMAIHIGSFEFDEWLTENVDSSISFLPYRLKDNLETGVYKIYEKFNKKSEKDKLLIDAKYFKGQLHGVYNEYDIENGKIKIYCVYNLGQLEGRKTVYFYDKKGVLQKKTTKLWKNGKLIDNVP